MATSMMKQRLIGAAVLIALGVIFIPMLLTGEGSFLSGDMESNIPKKPMYELQAPKVLPLDKRPEQASEPVGEPAAAAAKPNAEKVKTESAETAKPEKMASATAESEMKQQPLKETTKPEATVSTAGKAADSQQAKQEKKADEKTASTDKAEPATSTTVQSKTETKTSSTPAPASAPEKKQAAPAPVKTVQKKPIVSGWVVQLGSFSVQKNALNLRDKLRKNGHASFVEEYKHNGKTSYRVRVGPELTRELANELKKKLKAETKMDGFVIEFPGGE